MQTAELKPLMQTLAPHKVFGARLQETSYEVCVQDMHWAEAGEIQVFSDRFCLVELAEPPAPGRVRYQVQSAGSEPLRTGLLNILPPESERTVRWDAGHRHAVLCVLEPARLGLVGGTGWDWCRADAANTVDIRNERLRTAMQWLAEEAAIPSFGAALQANCIVTLLAVELRRHFGMDEQAQPSCSGKLDARQLARLKELVDGCEDPGALTLAALAAACRLPARDLSARFKASTGQTLRSWVAASHIERAKLLLADRDLMIKQVAFRSGFRSAAAFGEAFRRATGITPVQFRQRLGLREAAPLPH